MRMKEKDAKDIAHRLARELDRLYAESSLEDKPYRVELHNFAGYLRDGMYDDVIMGAAKS